MLLLPYQSSASVLLRRGLIGLDPAMLNSANNEGSNNSQRSSNGYYYERVKKKVKISHEGTKLSFQNGKKAV